MQHHLHTVLLPVQTCALEVQLKVFCPQADPNEKKVIHKHKIWRQFGSLLFLTLTDVIGKDVSGRR